MSAHDLGPLLCAPDAKAKLEARNGVEQLDYITDLVEAGARELRESHVLGLQDIAIRDVYLVALRAADASLRIDDGADAAARDPDTGEITTFLKRMLDAPARERD